MRALLARAREEELELLSHVRSASKDSDLTAVASELWGWLSADGHRELLTLWVEGYARSLIDVGGPWANFARSTVEDWLGFSPKLNPRRSATAPAARVDELSSSRSSAERYSICSQPAISSAPGTPSLSSSPSYAIPEERPHISPPRCERSSGPPPHRREPADRAAGRNRLRPVPAASPAAPGADIRRRSRPSRRRP